MKKKHVCDSIIPLFFVCMFELNLFVVFYKNVPFWNLFRSCGTYRSLLAALNTAESDPIQFANRFANVLFPWAL